MFDRLGSQLLILLPSLSMSSLALSLNLCIPPCLHISPPLSIFVCFFPSLHLSSISISFYISPHVSLFFYLSVYSLYPSCSLSSSVPKQKLVPIWALFAGQHQPVLSNHAQAHHQPRLGRARPPGRILYVRNLAHSRATHREATFVLTLSDQRVCHCRRYLYR